MPARFDHGFDSASAKDLQARLKPLIRTTQPRAKKIAHRGIWVEPSLLAEIEYAPSPRRAKCGIRFSRASGRTSDETHSIEDGKPLSAGTNDPMATSFSPEAMLCGNLRPFERCADGAYRRIAHASLNSRHHFRFW
jgi:hypothetical protein